MNAGPNRTVSNVGQQAAQTGPAQGAYGSPNVTNPSSVADLNLDPSDFPALGGGNTGGAAPHAASNSLLSSYATQAGAGGLSSHTPQGQGSFFAAPASRQQREFSAEDFPALGGVTQQQDGQSFSQVNGSLTNGQQSQAQSQAQSRSSQEQASAAAALAHKQSLLGTMSVGAQNQARGVSNAAASTLLPDDALSQKRNYATKLSNPQGNTSLSPYSTHPSLPSNALPSSSAQHSPNQTSSHLNGISQRLDGTEVSPSMSQQQQQGTSPSIAGRPLPPATGHIGGGAAASNLPPQLSNLLLHQHLSSQPRQQPVQQINSTIANSSHAAQASTVVPQTPAQQVLYSPADRFGLLGLLNIIKMSADPDMSMITLGTDLEKLGLDLGSSNNLASSFITPWAEPEQVAELNLESEFQLPSCYNVQPPPALSKMAAFTDETLFFIFYSQPRDAAQEAAAEQLYKRNWRYHKDLHLWLTKDVGSEPTQKTATYERGTYIFFDPNIWERVQKEFVLVFEHLETRHRNTGVSIQQTPQPQAAYPGAAA